VNLYFVDLEASEQTCLQKALKPQSGDVEIATRGAAAEGFSVGIGKSPNRELVSI
jgi:hypothetical protein